MKILYVAEIVGKAGIFTLKKVLPKIQKEVDFIIACGDGTTNGYGLGRNHAAYLRKLGVNVITTGDCCFYKKDLVQTIDKLPYVLRPVNLGAYAPGYGSRVYSWGTTKVGVIVLLGQSGFNRIHGENPFIHLPILLERLHEETPIVIVDFHGATTAEKQALFALAAGKTSAVIGSHGRVQTADARILAGGTAVLTDAGRTGSLDSVGGTAIYSRIREYQTGVPEWSRDAWDRLQLQGVIIDIDIEGKAKKIEPIRIDCKELPHERDRHSSED
ncbi:MAG: YmdB family metallophosphoesterase [Treponemataceae bacterium]|nr:YmdB family metallophosphoesterase [Treponemataceae bacterium]